MDGFVHKDEKLKKIFGSTITMLVFFNILLAVFALIRDVVLASALGTTAHADALFLAFFLPDIFGNSLLAASIGISCIPVFTRISLNKGSDEFGDSVKSMVVVVFLFCLLFMILCWVFRSEIIGMIGKGMTYDTKDLTIKLFSILLPVIIIYPLAAIGSSVSNVHNNFTIPALTPVIFNMVFLMGIILTFVFNMTLHSSVFIIAYSILVGLLIMLIMIWTDIGSRKLVSGNKKFKFKKEIFKDFVKIYAPYTAVLFAYQSVQYVERYLASLSETGTIAGLNYAYRISQLPVWVFVAAVGTFSFPSVAKLKAVSQEEQLKSSVIQFLKLTFIIILPFTAIIFILREPIVKILFQWGAFDQTSIKITTDILTGYAVAIVGQGIFLISIRFFMAVKSMLLPMMIVLFSSGMNILADFILIGRFGSAGLGYGAAVGGVINATLLMLCLNSILHLGLFSKFKSFLRIIAACVPIIVLSFAFKLIWDVLDDQLNLVWKLLYGISVFISGSVLYVIALYTMKVLKFKFLDRIFCHNK